MLGNGSAFQSPRSVLSPSGGIACWDVTYARARGGLLSICDKDGAFYICEQAAAGQPPRLSIRDADGTVMAQWPIRYTHGLWVDSHGDIYLGVTTSHSVDKYVRVT